MDVPLLRAFWLGEKGSIKNGKKQGKKYLIFAKQKNYYNYFIYNPNQHPE